MRAVNLLPKDDRRAKRRQANPLLIGAVGVVVAMTAVFAAMFLSASAGVAHNQKLLEASQVELAATPVPTPSKPGSSELSQDKATRVTALSAAVAGRVSWDRVLRELSLVLPDDVWLSSFSGTAPTVGAAAAGATSGFSIAGNTYSHDGVARLLARLALVPQLSNIQLQHSALTVSDSGRKVVDFAIVASIKPPGSPS